MSQRTLVPFDGSDPAMTALDEAIAEHSDGEIIALNVINPGESSHVVQGSAAENLHEQAREDAEELLTKAEHRAEQRSVTLTTAIETGQPANVIIEYADANNIDHIVMGSHGRSGVSKILVGSVAENVVQKSPVTITITR
jgi:nucleotide-binding universal stress UspA family protein